MIYTADNTQPGTKVTHKGEHIPYVTQVDTGTSTLTICQSPLVISAYAEELLTYERKFTSIEVLPDAEMPNLFICNGEIT